MISPTVGRKVWFFENAAQRQPIDATVIKVWGDTPTSCVNLDIVDPDTGAHSLRTSVAVGDEETPHQHFRWMPYQLGQAAKAAKSDSEGGTTD